MGTKFIQWSCLLYLVTIISCGDDCKDPNFKVDDEQLAADIVLIDQYLAQEGINAEVHPSGIRYTIEREGTGSRPEACDNINAAFEGKLISDGSVFSPNNGQILALGNLDDLIPGWQIGIPLIKQGGRIILYIPSVYGYGEEGRPNGGIPQNANLEFEILLF